MSDFNLTKADLVGYFESSCTPRAQQAIGVEFEQFIFSSKSNKRLLFQGLPGVQSILKEFIPLGWEPKWEAGKIIGLVKDRASITIEPGGQFEFSSQPHQSLQVLFSEIDHFEATLKRILDYLDCYSIKVGVDPITKPSERQFVPKIRYDIMQYRMLQTGSHGLDMMTNTCTIQANLDYESETDMAEKMWIATALQPIATALFANSAHYAGSTMSYQSTRSHIWHHTDPSRCGFLPCAVGGTMRFEDYVDYALTVPMYFIVRDGRYLATTAQPFSDFMEGKLRGYEDESPMLEDWILHLSTAFPDVRLKNIIEMRGADCGPFINALPAFWIGALYDEEARREITSLIKHWTVVDIQDLSEKAYQQGLNTMIHGQSVHKLCLHLLATIKKGLRGLTSMDGEAGILALEPIEWLLTQQKTLAEIVREKWATITPQNLQNFAFFTNNPRECYVEKKQVI